MNNVKYIGLLLLAYCVLPVQAQLYGDSLTSVLNDSIPVALDGQSDMAGYFYKVFTITFLLIFVAISGLYLFKRFGNPAARLNKSPIKILSRQSIGPKQFIIIALIENKKYALGVTDHSIQLLSELGEADEEDLQLNEHKSPPSFAVAMERFRKK